MLPLVFDLTLLKGPMWLFSGGALCWPELVDMLCDIHLRTAASLICVSVISHHYCPESWFIILQTPSTPNRSPEHTPASYTCVTLTHHLSSREQKTHTSCVSFMRRTWSYLRLKMSMLHTLQGYQSRSALLFGLFPAPQPHLLSFILQCLVSLSLFASQQTES